MTLDGLLAVTAPGGLWGTWNADVLVAVPLLLGAWAYARGVERLWRRAGRGAVVAGWQAGAFALGLLAVAVALLSPLDALAHTLFSAHMVQHLLLVLVAAPLLALSGPLAPLTHGLGGGLRRRAHRLRLPPSWRRWLGGPSALAVAVAAHVVVLWAWHLPALYTAALDSALVHALEHGLMLGTALAVWGGVVAAGGPVRRASPLGAVAMFAVATMTVGLGAALTFAPVGLYEAYTPGAAAWGLALVEDQQLGGAIMWAASGALYTLAGAGLFGWWLVQAERPRTGGPGRSDGPPGAPGPPGGRAAGRADDAGARARSDRRGAVSRRPAR